MTQSPHDPQVPPLPPTSPGAHAGSDIGATGTTTTPAKLSDSEARTWSMLTHVAGLAIFLPLGHILGPLIIWLIKKDEHPSVDAHGREALNFQVSWTIWGFIAFLTVFVLIGFVLMPLVGIAWLVLVIIATVKANNGEFYKYPLTIRFF